MASFSARWFIWPPLVVGLLTATGALVLQQTGANSTVEHLLLQASVRDGIAVQVADLRASHDRTVRRVREGLRADASTTRLAVLTLASQRYAVEQLERVDALRQSLNRELLADPELWARDQQRLGRQARLLQGRAADVGSAIDGLLGAASVGDTELQSALTTEFERTAQLFGDELEQTQALLRRAPSLRPQPAPGTERVWSWLVVMMGAIVSVWGAAGLLRMLGRLPGGPPRTLEEQNVAEALKKQSSRGTELQNRLQNQTGELQRSTLSLRRLENELALLRIYNENLVNSMRAAIVATDPSHRIVSVNRRAREMLGLDDRLVGTSVEETPLYRALDQPQGQGVRDLQAAAEQATAIQRAALSYSSDQGLLIDLSVVPYLDEGGAVRGLLWVADDVTETERTKNQLLAAEHLAAVGRLSAQVAHEIRNPLSAIALNAELLQEEIEGLSVPDADTPSEAAQMLHAIASEVERLSQITEGYLELARMPRPDCRLVEINQVLRDLLNLVGEDLKRKGILVELSPQADTGHVWGDPGQLRQAFLNIVRNAGEAIEGTGTVSISTQFVNGHAIIAFVDDGPGVPSDVAPRVFEPFYTTKPNGTGLGLSLTEQIIAEHHGTIELKPIEPRGTLVRIKLPVADGAPTSSDAI